MGPILGGSPFVRFASDSAVVVCHGNSITFGQSGATIPTGAYPYQLQRLTPVNNRLTCVNKGVNGQRWSGMRTQGAEVDALFVEGKQNVLLAWEGHNSIIGGGLTPAQAWADCQAYCADRLAAHPRWKIIHATTLPACYQNWSDSDSANSNALLEQYNALLRAGWQSTGAKGLVEMRQAGSPFAFANYQRSTFIAANISGQSLWPPNDQNGGVPDGQNVGQLQWVHPSDVGYTAIAQMWAAVMRSVAVR